MKKIFNVVCVTKRTEDDPNFDKPIKWHMDITGEAILDTERNTVLFHGMEHPVSCIRSGLDSMSHVISIKVRCSMLDIWELYTDTPAEGSSATPEKIRENAKHTIARG